MLLIANVYSIYVPQPLGGRGLQLSEGLFLTNDTTPLLIRHTQAERDLEFLGRGYPII
jgi:hypothetical protein